MKKPRSTLVLMPLPGSRTLTWETMTMIRQLDENFSALEVPFGVIKVSGFDQAQARDELFARFWAAELFDQCITLDGDIMVPPEMVMTICTLEEPLLVAPYEMRNADAAGDRNTWAIDQAGEKIWAEVREGKQMMRVRGAGMGFVRIRRDALAKMIAKYGKMPSLNWTSHYEEHPGLPVCGLCTPIVHEHPDGSGVLRRRSEDGSFFARAKAAGVDAYALLDVPVWHDARGGRTWLDGILDEERKLVALKKRARAELEVCPDDLLGLVDVLDGAYDVHGLEFEEPPVILDVGANIGAFAVWAGKRWPLASITCYEPHPAMADLCRRNTGPEVEVFAVAVTGDESEAPVKLFDGTLNQGERTIHPIAGAHAETFTETPSMFAGKLPPCDVLKIDTEGCEREILEHYPAGYLEKCSAVFLEWHSVADYRWMRQWLHDRGFRCLVDRARGAPKPDRELCFVRKGVMLGTSSWRES